MPNSLSIRHAWYFLVMIDHVEPAQVREQLTPWLARLRRTAP